MNNTIAVNAKPGFTDAAAFYFIIEISLLANRNQRLALWTSLFSIETECTQELVIEDFAVLIFRLISIKRIFVGVDLQVIL